MRYLISVPLRQMNPIQYDITNKHVNFAYRAFTLLKSVHLLFFALIIYDLPCQAFVLRSRISISPPSKVI